MKKENKYEVITKFKVFEIREGLLKEPKENYYGIAETIFDEYKSFEEAEQAILKDGHSHRNLVILPITYKRIKYD